MKAFLLALLGLFLLPGLAGATGCDIPRITQRSALAGTAGAAINLTIPAQAGVTWRLQGFTVTCGHVTAAPPTTSIVITGLTGVGNPTYLLEEEVDHGITVTDQFNGVAGVAPNTPINLQVPAVPGGSFCAAIITYCD